MIHRKRERFPIYTSIFLDIVIADTSKEVNELFENKKQEEFYACVSKESFEFDNRWFHGITIVLCTEQDEITPSIIVHEAVHIKNMLWDYLGIKSKYKNDEHEAYFIEWLFEEISKEFAIFNLKH
jgi:hypothetical protein